MEEQIIMHRMCKVLHKETKKGVGILMKKVTVFHVYFLRFGFQFVLVHHSGFLMVKINLKLPQISFQRVHPKTLNKYFGKCVIIKKTD